MGEERRRLLLAVTTALTLSLLSVCPGGASLVRARVGRVAELGCDLAPSPPDAAAAAAPGATAPGAVPDLFPLHVVEWVRLGYNVPILIKFGVYAPRVHPNYKGKISPAGMMNAIAVGGSSSGDASSSCVVQCGACVCRSEKPGGGGGHFNGRQDFSLGCNCVRHYSRYARGSCARPPRGPVAFHVVSGRVSDHTHAHTELPQGEAAVRVVGTTPVVGERARGQLAPGDRV
ncbi:unnamed protein product [Boreogadus saida]